MTEVLAADDHPGRREGLNQSSRDNTWGTHLVSA